MSSENKKPLVIYHGNCADGFTAAYIIWSKHPDWEFYPGVYGQEPPDVAQRDVYMVDFSYKAHVIEQMAKHAYSITILDHHKSAEADLSNEWQLNRDIHNCDVNILFDMNKSGARLVWEHFYTDVEAPRLVQYVEDRDLWLFKYPETRAISACIFSYAYDFVSWGNLHRALELPSSREGIILQGQALERKHHKDVAELVEKTRQRREIGGVEIWVANLPYTMASDAAHLLCYDDKTFGGTYYIDSNNSVVWSLRSKGDGMDVSEIAAKLGGGGHKHAAGFRIENGPTWKREGQK